MTETDNLVKRLPTEMGGLEGSRIQLVEHEYYEHWIVAFANILFQKQILTPEELARWSRDLAEEPAKPARP
jgi:hypothetical protein